MEFQEYLAVYNHLVERNIFANGDMLLDTAVELLAKNCQQHLKQKGPPKARIDHYVELVIPRILADGFFELFHLSRGCLESLILEIGCLFPKRSRFSVEKKILLTIWCLVHPETYNANGERFGLSHSTCHYLFSETVTIFKGKLFKFVKFPNKYEQSRISNVSIFITIIFFLLSILFY